MKALKRIMWIVTFLPFAITAFIVPGLPDTIPTHYNSSWKVDGYGSKYVSYLLPAVIIGFTLAFALMIRSKEKQAETADNEKEKNANIANAKVLAITTIVVTAGFAAMQCAFLYAASKDISGEVVGSSIISKITYISVAILLIVAGNYMPRTKRNGMIGLRCSWSMYNDITWERSNRFAGKVLVIAGILILIITLLVGQVAGAISLFVLLGGAVAISLVYAKRVYTEQKALNNSRKEG